MNAKVSKKKSGRIKGLLLALCLLCVSALCCCTFSSCKKAENASELPEGEFGNHPRSTVPDELVGYWIAGVSSISNFWGYDGVYKGPANEIAVGYMFYKDGRAKEYFYYTSTSTYCRTQVLGYKEGTVKIDPANKTLEMFYASGNYRGFNSCGSSNPPGFGEIKKYTAAELYPNKKMVLKDWTIKENNGKKVLEVPLGGGEVQRYVKSTEPQK